MNTTLSDNTTTRSYADSNRRTRLLSSSSLEGNEVYNRQEEHLGEIKDFMIDLDSGHIAYAVLSFGGFMGMGDKLFAVPFEKLTTDTVNKRFILDATREQLENAPGFDKDHWPQHEDNTFLNSVYSHYGYESYDKYRTDRYNTSWYDRMRSRTSESFGDSEAHPAETYEDRKRQAREGTMMDVIDSNRDGV